MRDQSLRELKVEFILNQITALKHDLEAFIASHAVLCDLPSYDQKYAAEVAATAMLGSIPAESIVGLVR